MYFQYLIFKPRPKKDGLHDSGYRYIKLTGVTRDGEHHELGQYPDHLVVEAPCNIDVQDDGTIRIMPWSGKLQADTTSPFWYSSAIWDESGMLR